MIRGLPRRFKFEWALLGMALLSIGAVLGYWIYADHGEIEAAEGERLQVQARVIEENLGSQLTGIDAALAGIRNDVVRWNGNRIVVQPSRRLSVLSETIPGVRTWIILDAAGTALASNRSALVGRNFGERDYFKVPRARPKADTLYVSPPFKSVAGVVTIDLTRALLDPSGRFAGVISASLDPAYFDVLMRSVLYAPDMRVVLSHWDGKAFVFMPHRKELEGMEFAIPGSFFSRHRESGRKATLLVGTALSTGDERIMASRTIDRGDLHMDKPLIVHVSRNLPAVFAAWRRDAQLKGSIFGILVVGAVLGLLLFQRRRQAYERLLEGRLAERRQAEEARLEDAERHRIILQTALDGFWLVDRQGRLLEVNEAYCRMSGYGAQELLSMRVSDLDADEKPYDTAGHMQKVMAQGEDRFESRHRRKDGSVFDVAVSAQFHAFEGGQIVVFLQDISGRRAAEGELRQFKAIIDSTDDAIIGKSLEGIISSWNPGAETVFGYSAEEAIGQPLQMLIPPGREKEEPEILARLSRGERVVHFESVRRRKDGQLIDVSVTISPIFNEERKVIGASKIARDITGRRRAESELRTRSHAIEQSPASIVITDPAGNIEYVNPRFEQVTGYTRAEVLGKNPRVLKSGMNPEGLYVQLWQAITCGGEWRGDLCNRRKNGELFWEFAVISAVKGPNGRVEHYAAVKEDITERKRAEAALRENERNLQLFIDHAPAALAMFDRGMRYISASRRWLSDYGLGDRELRGLSHYAVFPEIPENWREIHRRALAGETLRADADRFGRADGSVQWIQWEARPWYVSGGEIGGIVIFSEDLTERKRLEELHLQALKLESLGTLAGGIAHDFNNILAAIRGNADLAAEHVGPDHAAAQSLEQIRKASLRARDLVRRLMTFARPGGPQKRVVELGAVVSEAIKLLRPTLPASLSLSTEFDRGASHVLADAGQVHEAVVNLTTNAAYAIGARTGSIEYRIDAVQVDGTPAPGIPALTGGRYARLTVTDNGRGMDAATQERIFDAFYTTKPAGEGTGLGLSMVHGIMKSCGGAVTVESAPGKGASFALYFPAAREEAQSEAPRSEVSMRPAVARRVLYVDDEEALVALASRALSRLGHRITGFTDPEEALEAFRAHPQDFDAVVTDLSMPHMSGFEFASEVLGVRPGMPVIMMSGYLQSDDESNARAIGIREVMLKPATMDDLGRALDGIFRSREQAGRQSD